MYWIELNKILESSGYPIQKQFDRKGMDVIYTRGGGFKFRFNFNFEWELMPGLPSYRNEFYNRFLEPSNRRLIFLPVICFVTKKCD